MKDRIYLEKFASQADYGYFERLVFNEQAMKMNYGRVFTPEEAKGYYSDLLQSNQKHPDFGQFKVFEKEGNAFIGTCALSVNDDLTEAELEYLLLPEYWGRGYGSEMAAHMMDKAEQTPTLRQVVAITDPNNAASRKLLMKLGFSSSEVYAIDNGSLAERFVKNLHGGNGCP